MFIKTIGQVTPGARLKAYDRRRATGVTIVINTVGQLRPGAVRPDNPSLRFDAIIEDGPMGFEHVAGAVVGYPTKEDLLLQVVILPEDVR